MALVFDNVVDMASYKRADGGYFCRSREKRSKGTFDCGTRERGLRGRVDEY